MEYKDFVVEGLKADGDSRTVEGFGSIFGNVDSYGDIVMPGAFAKSIAGRKVSMLWQHDAAQPIGVWDEVEETKRGLRLKGRILPTQLGNDAYLLAREGAITGLSIGFSPEKHSYNDKGARQIEQVRLYEVSLVTFPANEKATITQVKTRPQTLREFENFLREGGKFSQRDATTVALHGFKALATQGEPDEGELREIRDLLNQFKL